MSDELGAGAAATSWREQAVARSLDSARTRAEHRVQRFLDAAVELINASGNEFTVQEVVERSGQSLRSFYQYFGGKQELLLALFEESVNSTTEYLREQVEREQAPLARLQIFVREYYNVCRPARRGKASKTSPTPVLSEFAQQLLTSQPKEAARAFAPLVALFEELYGAAAERGAVRQVMLPRRMAGVVLEAIMFNAFSTTIGGASVDDDDDPAGELWDLLFNGMKGMLPETRPVTRRS